MTNEHHSMDRTRLANIDLNLLVAFDALMVERHVTRASQLMGLSQPAMSRALGRLRSVFDDPLFLRAQGGMQPTPRAEQLGPKIRQILREVQNALEDFDGFDAAYDSRHFRVAIDRWTAATVTPALLHMLQSNAPHVSLECVTHDGEFPRAALDEGSIDLALGSFQVTPPTDHRTRLLEEGWACLHGHIEKELTLEAYCAAPHIVVESVASADLIGLSLSRMGLRRNVIARFPDICAAMLAASQCDAILTLPYSLASSVAPVLGLRHSQLPFEALTQPIWLAWSERTQKDPGNQWLRTVIQSLVHAGRFTANSPISIRSTS